MLMKKEDYIALGKWIKDNSYLQLPANIVDDYFKQLEELKAELEAKDLLLDAFNRSEFTKLQTELKQSRAEIKRLSTIIDNRAEDLEVKDKYKQLQTENDRYKKALQEIMIIKIGYCDKKPQGDYGCNVMQDIAEQALCSKP